MIEDIKSRIPKYNKTQVPIRFWAELNSIFKEFCRTVRMMNKQEKT